MSWTELQRYVESGSDGEGGGAADRIINHALSEMDGMDIKKYGWLLFFKGIKKSFLKDLNFLKKY